MNRKVHSLIVVLVMTGALDALAHDFSASYSQLEVEGSVVRVALTLGVDNMHSGPEIDVNRDGRVVQEELDRSWNTLIAAIQGNYLIATPESSPLSTVEGYQLTDQNVLHIDLQYQFDEEVTDLLVVSTLDQITQPNHRHLLQLGQGEDSRYAVLTSDFSELTIDHAAGIPFWVTILDFVELGIEHIFTGYDHLAFLVALLLATTTLLSLAKIVTCFTIAHSVTLILATLDLVVLPSRLIESLIGLSIAYVAIENFTGRMFVHRWMVTFLFGLVHGFGFSNVLREMDLSRGTLAISLFSFNIGVEIGQLAFVAVLFPPLFYLSRSIWKEHVMSALSLAIMCLGFYWFVQRAFI